MNIIYILLDQIRKDMLGPYGHQIVKTPNLDRLAKDGVRFNNAFTHFTFYRINAVVSRHY